MCIITNKMIESISIKEVKMRLGVLCKQQRTRYELSQEELAEELGISRYTIQKFESGKNATLDTVLKIANHFDLLQPFYQALQRLEDQNNQNSLY